MTNLTNTKAITLLHIHGTWFCIASSSICVAYNQYQSDYTTTRIYMYALGRRTSTSTFLAYDQFDQHQSNYALPKYMYMLGHIFSWRLVAYLLPKVECCAQINQ